MSYIIFKDIYQSRKSIVMYMAMGLFFAIIGINSGNMVMVGIPTFLIVYSVVARNELYEDKNRGYDFLKTLPIKPYKIVVSKFLTTFILSIIGSLYALSLILVLGKDVTLSKALTIVLISGGISLVVAGVLYVMVYKLGAIKAINITRFVFISFAFIPFIVAIVLKSLFSKDQLISIIESVSTFNITTFFVVIVIAYIMLMLLSIRVFYKNR